MIVQSRVFESTAMSWEQMCEAVSQFATNIGRNNLINISMAAAGGQDVFGLGSNGIIIVWYWADER